MKKYIFFSTCDLHDMGGVGLYFLGKAEYLEKHGWKVYMFHPGSSEKNCKISGLNRYVDGSLKWPSYEWRYEKKYRQTYLRTLLQRIGGRKVGDEVIIESYDYWTSPWVELLAKKLKAKHVIKQLNEWHDSDTKKFKKDLGFYKFKAKRRELFSEPYGIKIIFGENPDSPKIKAIPFLLNEDPVRDINNDLVNGILQYDYNIGYIGRANKLYLPNIIDGVCEFATKYSDKKILFVVLGDFSCRKEYYLEKSQNIPNLFLYELGDTFPIPKSLFQKLNVVIAGAGSARCAVENGALTLVADAADYLCNGLLGYETKNPGYKDNTTVQTSFFDGLERTFIKRVYEKLPFNYQKKPNVEECCKQNFEMIKKSAKLKRYYSGKNFYYYDKDEKITLKRICRYIFKKIFPRTYLKIQNKKNKAG